MSPNPESFVRHLRENGYHPRSDKHSNALAAAIVGDLLQQCQLIRERAEEGALVYEINFTLRAGTADWNVDLVLGPPPAGSPPRDPGRGDKPLWRRAPASVQIAIEIKSVMTEHHKAVKNRKRDLEAHHEHVHNYRTDAIACGVFVINAASTFVSPLRKGEPPTVHHAPDLLVKHCIDELRAVSERGERSAYGLDAKCAIVVDMDNTPTSANRWPARFVLDGAAPRVGDPLQYDSFIQTICSLYTRRFGRT